MKRNPKDFTLIIKMPYSTPYLYMRKGSGPQTYIAKLNEIDIIAKKLNVSEKEAFEIVLNLVKKRLEKTKKDTVREILEIILFDPYAYFGYEG